MRSLPFRRSFTIAVLALAACLATAGEDPVLPQDIPALPDDLMKRMKGLIKEAENNRGLPCLHKVPCGTLAEAGLRKKMVAAIEEELPDAKMLPLEISLKAFGFIPQDMNLKKYYPELLTSQVGGYYDPRRKYMVLVQKEGGILGKEGKEKYGAALAERMEETVLVHELTHAIQDQHFNLAKFAIDDPLSDEGAARLGLIEGDATLTMYNYFTGMKLETMPMVEQMMSQMFKDPKQLMDMSPDMPGAKEMSEAPAWFRDNLLFSYMQGFVFCLNIKKLGGQKLLDYAFTTNPPRSTEQILHPEKWHSKRDDPILITLPDISKALPGYTKAGEGQLGEQSIKVLLRENLKDDDKASAGAAGWGGDRFAVYEKDGNRVLFWITDWDTADDAKEFAKLLGEAGGDWKIENSKPTRVQVIRGKLAAADLAAVSPVLADAKAELPRNERIDPRQFAVKTKDDELLSENEVNLDKLLEQVGDNKELKEKLGGADVSELLKNPEMQAMVKKMLSAERPKGQLADDGRSYSNEKLGFELKLPASQKAWKLDGKPPIPMASVVASNAEGTVQVSVISQTLPIAMDIEMMGPMLEMGPKMAFKEYKKINAAPIKLGDRKGYELEYEGTAQGQRIRTRQRMFTSGATMIIVAAAAPPDLWDENAAAIKEVMEGFKFTAKAEQPAKEEPAKPDEKK